MTGKLWQLVTNNMFSIQIALTALCPDILIYSPSLRHVIIIELTCPCEENMERWHSVRSNKYEPLAHTIKKNCWAVDLFAVEVGAWGNPSRSFLSCLWKLGFPNKLARSTSKILGHTLMTSSFYIWPAWNIRSWEVEHTPLPTKASPSNQVSCQNLQRFSGKINFPKKPPLVQLQNM